MRKTLCLAVAMASLSNISSAQTITETFGSGVNAFSIDFVEIGNPGNQSDYRWVQLGYPTIGTPGSVSYRYNIGKYEISRDQIVKANTSGGLGITLFDMTLYGYGGNGVNRPATGISWLEAARYVNWLNSSKGYQAAYKFINGVFSIWSPEDVGYDPNNKVRNSNAKFVIPSQTEWYKSAYGSPDGTWYIYPTGSDTIPRGTSGGTSPNTAVYGSPTYGGRTGPADITNAGGLNAWGTMAQGGNAQEWMETASWEDSELSQRMMGGGSWSLGYSGFYNDILNGSAIGASDRSGEDPTFGFRVAMIPEPSSLTLLALGGVVVALGRRRR